IICPNEPQLISLAEKIYQTTRRYINNNYDLKNTTLWNYYFKNNADTCIEIAHTIIGLVQQSYFFTTYEQYLKNKENFNLPIKKRVFLESYKSLILDKYPHEWFAMILQNQKHALSEEVGKMEIRPIDNYLFEFSDFNAQIFSHEKEPGKYYHVDLNKHIDTSKLIEHTHYLHSALLKYKGNWELYPPVSISRTRRELRSVAEISSSEGLGCVKSDSVKRDYLNLTSQNRFQDLQSDLRMFSNTDLKENKDFIISYFKQII
ncbi:MAG: hypothetical protein ACRDD0_08280, partial [Bacteroidales bacterium]